MIDLELAKEISKAVSTHGGTCYFVGGYVRDKLLHRSNKDIDIEVHNITPEQLKSILSTFGEVQNKGESFGVYGLKHYDLDISMPRSETSSGRGHKDFEVFVDPYIGLQSACSRRDFTINAMMENVLTGEIVDLYGGQKDLENGIIRHVDDKTFLDDPLRVLRACQFASRFSFNVAPETVELCRKADLSTLSKERIQTELEKALLKSEKPSIFFENLRAMNQLHDWFPELEKLIGCEQDLRHHPEGDAWNHTMLVIDQAAWLKQEASEPFPYMMSALYHDIGKPYTTTVDEKGVHSYDHHKVGGQMIHSIPYIRETHLIKYMANMTSKHMEPTLLLNSTTKPTSFCKMFDTSLNPHDLILIAQADKLGRASKSKNSYDMDRAKLENYLAVYQERMAQPCVGGQDLINAGFEPGPLYKDAMIMAHNFQVAGVPKEQALPQVLGYMKKEIRKIANTKQKQAIDDKKNVKPWSPKNGKSESLAKKKTNEGVER